MLKLNSKNQNIWVGSDWHFRHSPKWPVPLWKMRGFKSVQEQDNFILNSINKLVKPEDILIYLGDFSLNSSVEDTKLLFRSIGCRNIYKIWGNHHSNTYKIYKEARKELSDLLRYPDLENKHIYPLEWENVKFFGHHLMVCIDGQVCYMQHMAQLIWPFQNKGSFCCVGHSHSNASCLLPQANEGKILDCSLDVTLKYNGEAMFNWNEIIHIMNKKNQKTYDHHNEQTN